MNLYQRLLTEETAARVRLTPREREYLLWLSTGLRTDANAERMGVARITAELHLRPAREKLGAAIRDQALVKAMQFALITP